MTDEHLYTRKLFHNDLYASSRVAITRPQSLQTGRWAVAIKHICLDSKTIEEEADIKLEKLQEGVVERLSMR